MLLWTQIEPASQKFQGGAVTLGNFDGLHLGHQSLLEQAASQNGPVIVITFDPHPLQVLQGGRAVSRIFPREDLQERLPLYGVDLLVVLPFTEKLAKTSAPDFWREFVEKPFAPKHVVAGHDFAFGHSREGSLEFLRDWSAAHSARLHVMPPLSREGRVISSRRIRELVQAGDMKGAREMLDRSFYLRGEVVAGAGRGKTIGVPTLNLATKNEILPAMGVYATHTRYQGEAFASVTNIGVNPTFGGTDAVKIETHVLERAFEARGARLDIDFIERIRPEMKFGSIEDLKKRIQSDILEAKRILESHEALDLVKPGK